MKILIIVAIAAMTWGALEGCGPKPVMEARAEATSKPEPTVKAAAPVEGFPDPPFTLEEVAAYHHQQTGSNLTPGMLKSLYTGIAIHKYEQGGDLTGILDAARRALAFEQDEPTRLRLYSRLVDGYFVQQEKPLEQQRKNAAKVLLVALRELLTHDLPDTPPDLPSVGKYNVGGSAEAIAEAEKRHQAEMAAREKAVAIKTLVDFREEFTKRIVSEYGYRERSPQSLDELHDLALQYLKDETIAQQLRAAAEAHSGVNSNIPVLRLTKP